MDEIEEIGIAEKVAYRSSDKSKSGDPSSPVLDT